MASNGVHSKPKVLIPEKVSPDGLCMLQASLDVHERKGLSPDQLIEIIGEYEALIVRSETKVTAALLEAGKNLRVVARAGVGVDNVDLDAATRLGVIVVNSPQGNINAAAEHTIALLMAVARNVGAAAVSIKDGKWERSALVGVEVKGKTLSILGLGKVGLTVARAAGGLGMNLVAYDPYANPSLAAAANVELLESMDELLEQADFLTIHTPMIASTKGIIGASELSKMKKTARVLNVARGGIVDETALLSALDMGEIGGAGIDVFTTEPPQKGDAASRLIEHPKCTATPHLGASTVEAQENVSIDVCTQVVSILSGQLPRSAVNAPIILPEEYRTLRPFVTLLEKMGSLYTQHFGPSNRGKSVRTTFELTYEGSLASVSNTKPLFASLVKGLVSPVTSEETRMNVNIVNAELVAKERGILISESKSRDKLEQEGYAASVTLKARLDPRSPSANRNKDPAAAATVAPSGRKRRIADQIISGFVSNNQPWISRLGPFSTNFQPEGTLLICRNYDEPGKIGVVGGHLGKAGVNIKFMSVAPIERTNGEASTADLQQNGITRENEALMILGVGSGVDEEVRKSLIGEGGVLEAEVIVL